MSAVLGAFNPEIELAFSFETTKAYDDLRKQLWSALTAGGSLLSLEIFGVQILRYNCFSGNRLIALLGGVICRAADQRDILTLRLVSSFGIED